MVLRRLLLVLLAALIFGQLGSPAMAHSPPHAMTDMGAEARHGHDACPGGHAQSMEDGACSDHAGVGAAGCCATACAGFAWAEPAAISYRPAAACRLAPAPQRDAPSRSIEPPRRPPRAAS